MNRERPSRTRQVVILVLTAVAIIAWVLWRTERSDGYMCLPGDATVACVSNTAMADRFRADRFGRSTDLNIPLRIRQMANADANRKGLTSKMGEYDGRWWNNPLTGGRCATGVFRGDFPDCVSPRQQQVGDGINWPAVEDVVVTCSGSAFLGFLGGRGSGRGWVGAGLGGAGCLWGAWRA